MHIMIRKTFFLINFLKSQFQIYLHNNLIVTFQYSREKKNWITSNKNTQNSSSHPISPTLLSFKLYPRCHRWRPWRHHRSLRYSGELKLVFTLGFALSQRRILVLGYHGFHERVGSLCFSVIEKGEKYRSYIEYKQSFSLRGVIFEKDGSRVNIRWWWEAVLRVLLGPLGEYRRRQCWVSGENRIGVCVDREAPLYTGTLPIPQRKTGSAL